MTTILTFIFWMASLQGTAATPISGGQARATVGGATARSDISEPLPFVVLKLTPLDEPAPSRLTSQGPPISANNLQARSDVKGLFQFSGVPPGRYAISAEREGYVRADQYLPDPRQSPQSILTIAPGSKVEGLVVTMVPVPTITGTVYGPLGQRLAGAVVQAYRVQYTPYGRQLVRITSVLSHEGGEYRLFRLTPGYYYISASYSERSLRPWKSILELSPNLTNPDEGYSTVYYPAEMKVANAKVVSLHGGGVSNIDINFRETSYFRLSITLKLPPAQVNVAPLQNTRVALLPVGADLGSAQDFVIQGAGTNFAVERLPEGEYIAVALADLQDDQGTTYTGIVSETFPVRLAGNVALSIPTMYPIDIPGSISRLAGLAVSQGTTLQLIRADPNVNQTIAASVNASGQFTLLGVGPGIYDVYVQGMPRNAYLQEMRLGGLDSSPQRLLQIRVDSSSPPRTWRCDANCRSPRLVSDIPLTAITSIGGNSVSGRVVDGKNGAASGAKIILVPIEPSFRQRRDRYGVTFSDSKGAFILSGVQPGSYTIYAFDEIETDIFFDPDFNEQVSRQGMPVNVANGSTNAMDRALIVVTRDDVARLTR